MSYFDLLSIPPGVQITIKKLDDEGLANLMGDDYYKTLMRIRCVLDNERLSEFECIEGIIRLLEAAGIGGGPRHDF